jgi:hypothetical protein
MQCPFIALNIFNVQQKLLYNNSFIYFTAKNLGPEKFRSAFVSSIDACSCYDSFGATCYAICGKFS